MLSKFLSSLRIIGITIYGASSLGLVGMSIYNFVTADSIDGGVLLIGGILVGIGTLIGSKQLSLKKQIDQITAENVKYGELNEQANAQIKKLEEQIVDLDEQVDRFTLESAKYSKLNLELENKLKIADLQLEKTSAENTKYAELNEKLNKDVIKFKVMVDDMKRLIANLAQFDENYNKFNSMVTEHYNKLTGVDSSLQTTATTLTAIANTLNEKIVKRARKRGLYKPTK